MSSFDRFTLSAMAMACVVLWIPGECGSMCLKTSRSVPGMTDTFLCNAMFLKPVVCSPGGTSFTVVKSGGLVDLSGCRGRVELIFPKGCPRKIFVGSRVAFLSTKPEVCKVGVYFFFVFQWLLLPMGDCTKI